MNTSTIFSIVVIIMLSVILGVIIVKSPHTNSASTTNLPKFLTKSQLEYLIGPGGTYNAINNFSSISNTLKNNVAKGSSFIPFAFGIPYMPNNTTNIWYTNYALINTTNKSKTLNKFMQIDGSEIIFKSTNSRKYYGQLSNTIKKYPDVTMYTFLNGTHNGLVYTYLIININSTSYPTLLGYKFTLLIGYKNNYYVEYKSISKKHNVSISDYLAPLISNNLPSSKTFRLSSPAPNTTTSK